MTKGGLANESLYNDLIRMYDRSRNSHFKWTKKWGAGQVRSYALAVLLIAEIVSLYKLSQ